ncbi:MAG: hypothetical protein JW801_05250 [Bacteroidales bacterium]|nr:hypothetical protein [Bacteroidales bacterium]
MRYLALLLLLIPAFSGVQAQPSRSAAQKLQDEKTAFFNKELGLSQSESTAFWPIYNDYQNRRSRIASEKRTLMDYYSENSRNISDKEITEILNKYIQLEKQETALLETYNARFREVLPDEKVFRIYIAEINFKDYLLKQIRTR